MDDKNWPKDYPTHIDVPPDDALELDTDLYRIVSKDQPDADDFLASFKDPKQRHLGRQPKVKNSPHFYGTSFFSSHEKVKTVMDANPERFSGQMVAYGAIKPEHGLGTVPNQREHVSVWFYEGIYPLGFKVI